MLFSTRRFFLRKPCLVVLLLVLLLFYKVNSIDIYPREITYVDSISLNYKSNFIEGIKSSSDLKWRGLVLEQVTIDSARIAKTLIDRSPFFVSLRSMPHNILQLPVTEKKELFFTVIERLALFHNKVILGRRERLISLLNSDDNSVFLETMAVKYSLERVGNKVSSRSDTLRELLMRVDCIPPSLILAQAAIESGWGTSRFAQEGNNLFGQRVWGEKLLGMKAKGVSDAKFRLAVYPNISESVKSYLRNLNTHPFYESFRAVREAKRNQGQSIFGIDLVGELGSYSTRGEAYVSDVKKMIEFNHLSKLDKGACK